MSEAINKATPSVEAAPEISRAAASERDAETSQEFGEALLKTFFTGLSWTGAARGLSSIGIALRYMVFMRLLKPFDFGVIAGAQLSYSVINAATDPRIGTELVQQEEAIDSSLDTIFTTYAVRALIIGLVLVMFARPLGAFFHLGDAYRVFWAMAVFPILQSLQSPRLISLYRSLNFHFVTILNVSEVAASLIFGLIAGLYLRGWRRLTLFRLAGAGVP